MTQRQIQTLYCDDIRQEQSGKLTLVGVYSDSLLVAKLPVTLPRLCLMLRVTSPLSDPLISATVRVFKDDRLLQELSAGASDLAASLHEASGLSTHSPTNRLQLVQFLIELSPLQIDQPGQLRATLSTQTGILEGAPLNLSATYPSASVTLQ